MTIASIKAELHGNKGAIYQLRAHDHGVIITDNGSLIRAAYNKGVKLSVRSKLYDKYVCW